MRLRGEKVPDMGKREQKETGLDTWEEKCCSGCRGGRRSGRGATYRALRFQLASGRTPASMYIQATAQPGWFDHTHYIAHRLMAPAAAAMQTWHLQLGGAAKACEGAPVSRRHLPPPRAQHRLPLRLAGGLLGDGALHSAPDGPLQRCVEPILRQHRGGARDFKCGGCGWVGGW